MSSANCASRLAKARIEIPRITPGITSGVSINSDNADLPRNRARSSSHALTVPTATDSIVTQAATIALVPMLFSSGASENSPVRPGPPKNQSSVKPRQGGAG